MKEPKSQYKDTFLALFFGMIVFIAITYIAGAPIGSAISDGLIVGGIAVVITIFWNLWKKFRDS